MGFILMQGTLLYRNIRTYQQSVTKDFASHKKESARNFEVVVKFVLVPFVNKMKTVVFSLFLLIGWLNNPFPLFILLTLKFSFVFPHL